MKHKKGIAFALLMSAFLAGCSNTEDFSSNLEEGKNMKYLETVSKNLNKEDSYIQFEQSIEDFDGTFHETKITVREVSEKGEDTYSTGYKSQFFMAAPYTVLTEGDIDEASFSQVMDFTSPDKKTDYIALDLESGLIPQSESAKNTNDTLLSKEEVAAVIGEASKVETGKSSSGMGVYTGSDYYFKSIPSKINSLEKTTKTVDGVKYDIFTGVLEADKEELFLIYERASVEIWVESKTKRLHKEIYKDVDGYNADTGVGQVIYTYVYDKDLLTDEFLSKEIDDKVLFVKGLYEGEDTKSDFLDKTKEDYLKNAGYSGLDTETLLEVNNDEENDSSN